MYKEAYVHRYKYMVRHIRMTSLPSYPPSCTLLPASLCVRFTHPALKLHLPNYSGQDLGQPPSPSIYSLRPTNLFFRARQGRLLVLILVRWVSWLFLLCVLFCFLRYMFRYYLLRVYLRYIIRFYLSRFYLRYIIRFYLLRVYLRYIN